MQLVNPIWLWGLTGLMIPIGIHLLSRREGKIVKIGSIRHLDETNSKKFKSIRLNEFFLLILRCLIITIVVLFLSGFHFKSLQESGKWLIVETGLEHDPQFSLLTDSLKRSGFEFKTLTNGFPDLSHEPPINKPINYWDLLAELEKESLTQAVVLSYNFAEGFKGKRRSLPENVKWVSKNPMPIEFILNAIRISNDTLIVRAGYSNPDKTTFSTFSSQVSPGQNEFSSSQSEPIKIEIPKTIEIQIVNEPAFAYDTKMIVAALQAVDDKSPNTFNFETVPLDKFSYEKKSDWIIWLTNKRVHPADINCIYYQEKSSNTLFEARTTSSWALTQRLNEQIALEQNLTIQLGLILALENKYDETARQKDKRVLDAKLIWDTKLSAPQELSQATQTSSSEKYLMTLLILVLFFERWMAFKRRQ
jgi:hypothetical protein